MNWIVRHHRNRTAIDLDTILVGIAVTVVSETVCAVAIFLELIPLENQMRFAFEALIVAEAMLVEMIFAFVALNLYWLLFDYYLLVNDSVLCYCSPLTMISRVRAMWTAAVAEDHSVIDNDLGHEDVRSDPIQMV